MKLLRNEKFINIFCYTFCALYVFFVFAYTAVYVQNIEKIEDDFNSLSAYVERMNNQWAKEQIEINYDNNEDDTKNDDTKNYEILYTDGKVALLDSYDELYNSSSFYSRIQGIISGDAMGFNIRFNFDDTAVRFAKSSTDTNISTCYNEMIVKYLDTTAPSALKGMIEEQAQFGQKRYRQNSIYRQLETFNVTKSGNNLTANYSGSARQIGEVDMIPDNLLIINNDTIRKITYFKTKIKKGLPVYTVQAELDPQKATVDFAKTLKFSMDGVYFGNASYTSCIVTAIIDHEGHIIGMSSNDTVNCTIEIPGYGTIDIQCKYSLSFAFSSINKTISFKPVGFD